MIAPCLRVRFRVRIMVRVHPGLIRISLDNLLEAQSKRLLILKIEPPIRVGIRRLEGTRLNSGL